MSASINDPLGQNERPLVVGRYALSGEIAAGGMASVHLAHLLGQAGFSRTVAIKRLHAQFARDEEFRAMFLDEARLAARVRHPNALPALDVVEDGGELYIVMDYVHGEALWKLLRSGPAPLPIAAAIMVQALLGLHAAHEALDEAGRPLHIVHRDVSPQNILVGVDGVARVMDFGIAKAASRMQVTDAGKVKGKLAYMAPEQIAGTEVDRRTDIFAAGVVLWEALAGRRLLACGEATIARVANWQGLSQEEEALVPGSTREIVRAALSRSRNDRYATAREMATALAAAVTCASAVQVGEWVESQARSVLQRRSLAVQEIERASMESSIRSRPRQASEPTVPARPLAASRSRRHRPLLFALTGALVAAGTIGWVVLRDRESVEAGGSDAAAQPLSFQVRTAPRARDSSPAPGQPFPQAQEPVVEVSELPLTGVPLSPQSTLPESRAEPRIKHTARPSPPNMAPAARNDCNPPYSVGPNGVKRFKAQCLK